MLIKILQIAPLAAIPRPIAGVIFKLLIVTLPRSSAGALENFETIQGMLPHVVMLLERVNLREIHSAMDGSSLSSQISGLDGEKQSTPSPLKPMQLELHSHVDAPDSEHYTRTCSHSHSHSHFRTAHAEHTGPNFFGPAFRNCTSSYHLVPFDKALEIFIRNSAPPIPVECSFEHSLGCIFSEDIFSYKLAFLSCQYR